MHELKVLPRPGPPTKDIFLPFQHSSTKFLTTSKILLRCAHFLRINLSSPRILSTTSYTGWSGNARFLDPSSKFLGAHVALFSRSRYFISLTLHTELSPIPDVHQRFNYKDGAHFYIFGCFCGSMDVQQPETFDQQKHREFEEWKARGFAAEAAIRAKYLPRSVTFPIIRTTCTASGKEGSTFTSGNTKVTEASPLFLSTSGNTPTLFLSTSSNASALFLSTSIQ